MQSNVMDELEQDLAKTKPTAKKASKKATTKAKPKKEEVDPLMEEFQDVELDSVSVQQLDLKIKQWSTERQMYEEAKAESDRLKAVADNTGEWLKAFMLKNNKTSYPSMYGTVVVSKKLSVKFPDDTEDRKKIFDWIEGKEGAEGLLGLQSIHSAKFNKMFKEYQEAAIEKGETDFTIPGVGEAKTYQTVALRRK